MTLRVFVIAGETSGDFLAAKLLAALAPQVGGLELAGVGGTELAKQGLVSRFPMDELSLMGLAEIVPHLPRLIRRLGETAKAARAMQPDLVLTVDAPAFTLRVLHRLRGLEAVKVHYVAPQAWAWRPGRAAKLAHLVDRLLAVLPFEPAFFAGYGVDAVDVGHPIVEQVPALPAFLDRRRHTAPVLCLLPGSRRGEIARHVPVLRGTVARLTTAFPDLRCVLPTPPARRAEVAALTADWPAPLAIEAEPACRFERYAEADLALAASGTVGLELALARLPTIVIYRTSALTAAVVRRLVRVRHASLINLVADREVVPEFLQERCTAGHLAAAATELLTDHAAWQRQIRGLDRVALALGAGGTPPSARAAAEVLAALGRR